MVVEAVGVAPSNTKQQSYVEWGSVLAGAMASLATSAILLTFGAGVGLSAVSPWSHTAPKLTTLAVGSAFWLFLVALWSFALGGYLSARLRHPWRDSTEQESEFRDQAHGLLAWATAIVVMAIVATMGAPRTDSRSDAAASSTFTAAAVDAISRSSRPNVPPETDQLRNSVARALSSNLGTPDLSAPDRQFLRETLETRSGLPQPDADRRVTEIYSQFKAGTDKARKAGVVMTFVVAATLLVGAAVAWWAAGVGGLHRNAQTLWYGFSRQPHLRSYRFQTKMEN